jgi:enoyl-CoA hydratase/carnithine racemase
MFLALREAQERLRVEPGVRAVVLHGEGPSFCSGLDVAAVAAGELDVGELIDRPNDETANLAQTAAHGWRTLPMPVVVAVHGACFGGGLQIALGADIRIVATDARLSVMEIKLGLLPDMGISGALSRLLRADRAKELSFSGRQVEGAEAVELGLATRVADPPLAAALELAAEIAASSPEAVRAIKRLFDEGWNEPPERTLRLETELVRTLLGSANQFEAMRAAMAGEVPDFADPAT